MEFWVFLGSFLAVAAAIAVIYVIIRNKIRRFSRSVFGTGNIIHALKDIDSVQDQNPRSLNGCDSLLIPKILKDFPDFDVSLAKTYARDHLREQLRDKEDLVIHNVVIARYLRSEAQKTIVFQAAVAYKENGKPEQARYDLDYTYLLNSGSDSVAANCPNCGAPLGYGISECPYCGSRVANVLGNTWSFTEMRET